VAAVVQEPGTLEILLDMQEALAVVVVHFLPVQLLVVLEQPIKVMLVAVTVEMLLLLIQLAVVVEHQLLEPMRQAAQFLETVVTELHHL
jgi:hypothetical protein